MPHEYGYARGGFSPGAILTGMAVAIGAMLLLGAIVGGVAVAIGTQVDLNVIEAGWVAGIAFVLAQFLAYLWGGYTAGRMARGAGILNGFMVPVAALLLVVGTAALVNAFGADAQLGVPFRTAQVPVQQVDAVRFGVGIGIAALAAMFVGGVWGGALGTRWHDKLEAGHEVQEPQVRAA